MLDRRRFLGALGAPVAAVAAGVFDPVRALAVLGQLPPLGPGGPSAEDVARDEDFWFEVGQAFTVDRSLVNLNNGGVSPTVQPALDAQKRHLDFSNNAPPYAMWRVLRPQVEAIRQRMALQWAADTEEVAITRNASESLQILQFGADLSAGDHVLTTDQDYPRMLNTFRQRVARDDLVLDLIKLPVPAEDEDEIVRRFENAITERTRLILMCHMINLTGQVLPVKAVCAMARRHGIPVIVDGAHALAQLDFTLPELGCDNYSASLHKWLFAPIGTGFLWVRKEYIESTWPLMAASEDERGDIRKFEQIGTHPIAPYLAIGEALTFHQALGGARKEARLRYLRDVWAERLLEHPRIRLNTSLDPRFSCGIGNVAIDGVDTGALVRHLWNVHRILVTGITHEDFSGARVSGSVYTTREELDRFCSAMEQVADEGLPA